MLTKSMARLATIAVLAIVGSGTTATCAELTGFYSTRYRHVHVVHSARLHAPRMVGGFALAAATYTYNSGPLYSFWLRDCVPRPVIVGYTRGGLAIVRLAGACP